MEFEYDIRKSKGNKQKHGIDFEEAQELWKDPDYVEIPVRLGDEPRHLVIGKISDKYWTGVIIYRNEKIKIISVRRSRKDEVKVYEST
jgi:uncharacterized protein